MWQAQISEQAIVHVPVVMLTGMNKQCRYRWQVGGKSAQDGRHFHEIRPRADNTDHRAQISGPCLVSQDDFPLLFCANRIHQLLKQRKNGCIVSFEAEHAALDAYHPLLRLTVPEVGNHA